MDSSSHRWEISRASAESAIAFVIRHIGRRTAMYMVVAVLHTVPGALSAQITVDDTSSAIVSGAASMTWSHTVNGGSNRVLFVGITTKNAFMSTGVTYADSAMTLVGRWTGKHTVEIWRLIAPPVGTANVIATFSQSLTAIGGAINLNGVHQTSPTGSFVGAGGDGTPPTVTVPSATDELVLDVLFADAAVTATAGGGQTARWNRPVGANAQGAASTKPGATSVQMTWTLSPPEEWELGAVSIKPAPNRAPSLSSSGNQTFWVGKAPTAISPLTVADTGGVASISAAADVRVRIPTGFNMTWDSSDVSATIGGNAAGKASSVVSYEDANKTLVIDIVTDFTPGDTIVVSDLTFTNFSAASGADNLELEIDNDDIVSATDDKTVELLPPGTPTFFSAEDQSFVTAGPPTPMSMITVRADASAPTITAANDLRIRIPFGFNMRWDGGDDQALILGTASAKVSSTVTFEDAGGTVVVDVLTDFDPNDMITIEGLSFRNFLNPSLEDNLELEVYNDGSVSAVDSQIIFIVAFDPPTLSSSKNQTFTVGDPPTKARTMRVTAEEVTSQITATDDIRIMIPAGINMIWDTSQPGKIGGKAKNKVSPVVTYENGGKTAVIDVLTDFAPDEHINVSKLRFMTFASASDVHYLELDPYNLGFAADVDDKTVQIFGGVFRVDVWPSITTTDTLPSNGSNYTQQFTVSNTGNTTDDFDLFTSTNPGPTITVVSMTGLDVTQGGDPDSARISTVPPSESRVVTVTYTVAMAAPGTLDTLTLLARAVSSPTQTDQGRMTLTVIRPNVTLGKTVTPAGTAVPGTDLTYSSTITNGGNAPAAGLIVQDSVPPEVEFKLGSATDSLPPGVSTTLQYSNDGGASWSYVPVTQGCGAPASYDACVTNIRWVFQDDLDHVAPDNSGVLEFVARIK